MQKIRNILLILSLVLLAYFAGFKDGSGGNSGKSAGNAPSVFNYVLKGANQGQKTDVDFSMFWDVWSRVEKSFYDKKLIDPQKMVYGAISGMVASLGDPYTVFLPPEQNKEAKDDLGGKFQGIGAQLGVKDKKIIVVAPLKGAPAETSGLKPGDWIMKVDGKDTVDWTLPEAVSKIRGEKGTKVNLTILHKDASTAAEIAVMRDEIKVASVELETKNINAQCTGDKNCSVTKIDCSDCDSVLYLKLSRFGDDTNMEWSKAVDQIKLHINKDAGKKIKGLVFDLRNNPGGYLSGSVFIASEFLSDGTVVMQESSDGNRQTYTVNRKGELYTIPLVVLINKGSASASEIVAGALHDRGRAKLIGETTFGKGSIQEAQELPGGAGVHITTAKWLLPSGKWINGTGIDPDYKVSQDESNPDLDLQAEKAIELLINKQ